VTDVATRSPVDAIADRFLGLRPERQPSRVHARRPPLRGSPRRSGSGWSRGRPRDAGRGPPTPPRWIGRPWGGPRHAGHARGRGARPPRAGRAAPARVRLVRPHQRATGAHGRSRPLHGRGLRRGLRPPAVAPRRVPRLDGRPHGQPRRGDRLGADRRPRRRGAHDRADRARRRGAGGRSAAAAGAGRPALGRPARATARGPRARRRARLARFLEYARAYLPHARVGRGLVDSDGEGIYETAILA
jgi:hypothetical protein